MFARVALASALFVAGCKPTAETTLVRADGVDFVAVLALGPDGALLAATPLGPIGEEAPFGFAIAPGDARRVVVGYSAADLEAEGLLGAAEVGGGPLELAAECDTALPAPTAAFAWSDGESQPIDPTGLPRLTAEWARASCPSFVDHRLWLDLACAPRHCLAASTPLAPCRFRLATTSCFGADLEVHFDARGRACVASGPEVACRAAGVEISPDETFSTAACTAPRSCEVGLHVYPPTPPPFTIERAALPGMILRYHADVSSFQLLAEPRYLFSGIAFDFAIVGDRVIVTAAVGEGRRGCPSSRDKTTRAVVFDRRTMAVLAERDTGTCFERILADGDGLLATYSRDDDWYLGRFDRDLDLIHERPLHALRTAPTGTVSSHRIQGLVALPGGRVALLATRLDAQPTSLLRFFDRATLAQDGPTVPLDRQIWLATLADGPTPALLLPDPVEREIRRFDLGARRVVGAVPLPRPNGLVNAAIIDTLREPATGALLAASTGDYSGTFVGTIDGGGGRMIRHVEGGVEPMTYVEWRAARGKALTLGVSLLRSDSGDWEAHGTLLDVARAETETGTWDLGYGPPSRATWDEDDRLWFLLPWAGELVRLRPNR